MDLPRFASKFEQFQLKTLCRIAFTLLLPIFAGCASVSVGNIHHAGRPPKKLPAKIFVREFEAPYDNFHVDRNDRDFLMFVKDEQHAMAEDLAGQLTKYIAPAKILPKGHPLPIGNYWIVSGRFDRVNQGSRALRVIAGFGAGGTKMETRVRVESLNGKTPSPFLFMMTTGGSGMAPGAVASFTPAFVFFWPGAVVNAAGASMSGISVDGARTAREITATLSEYCFQHGLITERRVRHPKKLGDLPPLQRPDFVIPKSGP